MKLISKISLVFLISLTTLISGTLIHRFVAESNGENITLIWETSVEENIKQFEILRGPDKDNLAPIAVVNAKGNNSSYTYIDENAYKTSASFYAYGLVLVDNSGSRSNVVLRTQIMHDKVSGFKRTWGSIKALFR